MKKNNLHPLSGIILVGLLLFPALLIANQLPAGKTDKPFAKWEWRNATLQSVAAQLSAVSGVDIVVDDAISSSRITLSLRDRTWQDVISIICNTKQLEHQMLNDNMIYIANRKDINDRRIQQANSARSLENVEELQPFVVKLKNTTAEGMLKSMSGILSSRGKAVVVQHTNSLLINELPKNIDKVRNFIEDMDIEILQISISSKIIEVASGFSNGMGIQWSFFDGNGSEVSHLPTPSKGYGIIEEAFERATYGVLDPNGFSIAMEYLFTNTNSEIVAEPQVTTLENEMALIEMKSEIPVTTLDANGTPRIDRIESTTRLEVTPMITGQGQIKMSLTPQRSNYEMDASGRPVVHTQRVNTSVVVQDGETIVIGGLSRDNSYEAEGGIPFLKDIPILGYLFKRHTKSNDKRDLIIFVTPHVVKKTKLDVFIEEQAKDTANIEISVEPQENISIIAEQDENVN